MVIIHKTWEFNMTKENLENPEQKKKSRTGDETRTDYDVTYEHDKKEKKKFKLKIIYNKKGCIASGHCVLSDPYNFELDEEFKAILVDGKLVGDPKLEIYEKIIETDEPYLVINAAKTCTPKVIGVIDMNTGKRIAP